MDRREAGCPLRARRVPGRRVANESTLYSKFMFYMLTSYRWRCLMISIHLDATFSLCPPCTPLMPSLYPPCTLIVPSLYPPCALLPQAMGQHQRKHRRTKGKNYQCDIYSAAHQDHQRRLIEAFVRVVETVNRLRRQASASASTSSHIPSGPPSQLYCWMSPSHFADSALKSAAATTGATGAANPARFSPLPTLTTHKALVCIYLLFINIRTK